VKSFIAALRSLVLPWGRTSGARIILDGDNARILVYDASDTLIAEISPDARVIKALDASGVYAKLDPAAPSGIADTPGPGLALGGMAGDVEPGSLSEFDDGFSRGLYLRTSSPVADPLAVEGEDYAAIRMYGRFHGADPQVQFVARGPDSFISLNDLLVDANNRIISYGEPESFTPSLGNSGTATYSQRVGWYYRIGPMIYFNAYFVVTNPGSGANPLTLHGPTNVDRTHRQIVWGYGESLTAGNNGAHNVVAFQSGSAHVWDRVRNSTGGNITGADLAATAVLTYEGWYREEI
jgi:hypothetical protein